jgi:flavoprotein
MEVAAATKKICWVVTGAGHFLREVADMLPPPEIADVYLTRAAAEVVSRYRVLGAIERGGRKVVREADHSSSAIILFSMGRYDALVVAPATSNTVAKCALGIADSLASTFFAQAGKSRVPVIVLPTDAEGEVVSVTPSGKSIRVAPRPVDILHAEELARFPGVSVARSPDELARLLAPFTAPSF